MAVSIKIYQDDELMIQYNGVDIYTNAESIKTFNGGENKDMTLYFKYSECVKKDKSCWTGKFICVTNKSDSMRFTPGKVYVANTQNIFDDTLLPYWRGEVGNNLRMFSKGSFEELQNDFLKMKIDIIEYKGGAEE